MTDLNETLQEIEKMFLMTAAVPPTEDARPLLKELTTFLNSLKIPTEELNSRYAAYLRSYRGNPALRKVNYNYYNLAILKTKKATTDLIKGLQALAQLAEKEATKNESGELSTESEPVTEPVSEVRDIPENQPEDRAE